MAMLTVALVATVCTTALWQQWRAIEVEKAERSRVQASWLLKGGLDWARLLLREDARSGVVDHLGEPWAVPLQEARLSGFLAAGGSDAPDATSVTADAFLSGHIADLQSKLNIYNLLENGTLSQPDIHSFERLFDRLGIARSQLQVIVSQLPLASQAGVNRADDEAVPLMPQSLEDLKWLGVSVQTISAIEPYVTLLPSRTSVNLNTASVEVLHAVIEDLDMADAQRMVTARERSPFRTLGDAAKVTAALESAVAEGGVRLGVASRYFEIDARVRLDGRVVRQRAIVHREGLGVRVIALGKY